MSPMLAYAIDDGADASAAIPDDSLGSREYSAVCGSDIDGRLPGAWPSRCRDASS